MNKILTFLIFVLSAAQLLAQPFQGSVFYRKASGATEPLPFAQVYHMERSKLIECDQDGHFSIDLKEKATLIATYVGYTRDTVVVMPGTASAEFYLTGENDIDQSVVTARQAGLSKLKPVKTEVITAAGLCKMACCALAESFENSASVTVGYSDAVTGARQIKLLGLSGTYTQMLDENRPVMRGIASPFGMSYIPGQWLESIQIAKGPSSVVNGTEAITGQINMEHRKPTDETPLFVQAYGSSDRMFEANIASALQMGPRWSVVNLAHIGGTASKMDHNGDGFRDEPEDLMTTFSSRWLYYAPSGMQIRFGGRFIYDDRTGGQMDFKKGDDPATSDAWGSTIVNRGINGYAKIGIPLGEAQTSNIALVLDFDHHEFDSQFGRKDYDAFQNTLFSNLLYRNELNERHIIEFGLTGKVDGSTHRLSTADLLALGNQGLNFDLAERSIAAFGEYTYTLEDKLTFVGGLSLERNSNYGWLLAPRANIKYSISDALVFRLQGGRGYRTASIYTDNLGAFSTGRTFLLADNLNRFEDAWTYGGNVTFYLPFGYDPENTYLSFDYFHNSFISQVIADQEYRQGYVSFYNLDGRSFTNTWQADFNIDIMERLNLVATFRYTDARVTLDGQGLVERPMTSRFKGVLNMQYATAMSKWTFDFTAQLNGPMRLPYFAAQEWGMEQSPIYPMFFAQVTRKFRGIDIYVGGENLGNYRQKDAIIGADKPFGTNFNASCVWGPLMGIKVYAGLRYTLWKI